MHVLQPDRNTFLGVFDAAGIRFGRAHLVAAARRPTDTVAVVVVLNCSRAVLAHWTLFWPRLPRLVPADTSQYG